MAGPWDNYSKTDITPEKKPWESYSLNKNVKQPEESESSKLYKAENLAGPGEALLNAATGFIAKPISEIAGLAATAKELVAPTPGGGNPRGFQQDVQNRLTYVPRTYLGQGLAKYNPMAVVGQGIGAASEGVGNLVRGDSDVNSLRGRLASGVQEAIPQGLGIAGARYAPPAIEKIPQALRGKSEELMQSALKPTIKELKNGKAATAIDTMLNENVPFSKKGVQQLRDKIDQLNDNISEAISKSEGKVRVSSIIPYVKETLEKFKNQVNPESDVAAVKQAWEEFKRNPIIAANNGQIPVQLAQQLKQGTYQQLGKKYGEMSSASNEAQKSIARGLKEGIAENAPEVVEFNKQESKLIRTLPILERRVLMDANKNPLGLSLLTANPAKWAMFMADKSAPFKAMIARVINSSKENVQGAVKQVSAPAIAGAVNRPPQIQPNENQE